MPKYIISTQTFLTCIFPTPNHTPNPHTTPTPFPTLSPPPPPPSIHLPLASI